LSSPAPNADASGPSEAAERRIRFARQVGRSAASIQSYRPARPETLSLNRIEGGPAKYASIHNAARSCESQQPHCKGYPDCESNLSPKAKLVPLHQGNSVLGADCAGTRDLFQEVEYCRHFLWNMFAAGRLPIPAFGLCDTQIFSRALQTCRPACVRSWTWWWSMQTKWTAPGRETATYALR
jgi:hypothetical protein